MGSVSTEVRALMQRGPLAECRAGKERADSRRREVQVPPQFDGHVVSSADEGVYVVVVGLVDKGEGSHSIEMTARMGRGGRCVSQTGPFRIATGQ